MSLITYKIVAAVIILLAGLIGVVYPLKVRAFPTHNPMLEMGDALASGIFLGAALFHMLPDAIKTFNDALPSVNYPLAEFFCAGGFLLLLFFERISGDHHEHHHAAIPYGVALILIIHSLIEGMVLGIYTTFASAVVIFVAIVAHKSSESFALAIILNRSSLSLRHVFILVSVFLLMTPLGIFFGTALTTHLHSEMAQLVTAAFSAFAAGTFLYMSTLHHINHHQREHHGEGLMEFFSLVLGLVVMGLVAVLEP
ncbi:MAG: ZIP family metal transporter [Pseudomonadota bacterium]